MIFGPNLLFYFSNTRHVPFLRPGKQLFRALLGENEEEYRAWSAPFPSQEFMAGARQFPSLVPIIPDNPAIPANKAAWEVFAKFEKPFITAFSDSDPVTKGGEKRWIETVPGARGQMHTILKGAGHFIQDDAAAELCSLVIKFMQSNSS